MFNKEIFSLTVANNLVYIYLNELQIYNNLFLDFKKPETQRVKETENLAMARAWNTGRLHRRSAVSFPTNLHSIPPPPPPPPTYNGLYHREDETLIIHHHHHHHDNFQRGTMMNLSMANNVPINNPGFGFHPRSGIRRHPYNNNGYLYQLEDETLILNATHENISYDNHHHHHDNFQLRGTINDVGLSEETIDKHLRTRMAFGSGAAADHDDEDQICVVCQDNLIREKEEDEKIAIARLGCGHDYHAECIKRWLLQKNSCPICKSTGLMIVY